MNTATKILLELSLDHFGSMSFSDGYTIEADGVKQYWYDMRDDFCEEFDEQWFALVCEDMKRPLIDWVAIAQEVDKDYQSRVEESKSVCGECGVSTHGRKIRGLWNNTLCEKCGEDDE